MEQRRRALHLSRAQLAARTGGMVSDTTIYRTERGRTKPHNATLALLATVLGCSIEELQ